MVYKSVLTVDEIVKVVVAITPQLTQLVAGQLDTNKQVFDLQLSNMLTFSAISPIPDSETSYRYGLMERNRNMKSAGLEFWKSQSRKYVSYRSKRAESNTKSSEARYIIDPATYRKLHKQATSERPSQDNLRPKQMGRASCRLPRTITGFNIQNKRWEELEVARLSEVSWNKEAFESLVVEPNIKRLIKALVI